MNKLNVLVGAIASMGLIGCAQTATESDFGSSARALIAEQTANKNPEPTTESGDGVRLQAVNQNYRSTVANRKDVTSSVAVGSVIQTQ